MKGLDVFESSLDSRLAYRRDVLLRRVVARTSRRVVCVDGEDDAHDGDAYTEQPFLLVLSHVADDTTTTTSVFPRGIIGARRTAHVGQKNSMAHLHQNPAIAALGTLRPWTRPPRPGQASRPSRCGGRAWHGRSRAC